MFIITYYYYIIRFVSGHVRLTEHTCTGAHIITRCMASLRIAQVMLIAHNPPNLMHTCALKKCAHTHTQMHTQHSHTHIQHIHTYSHAHTYAQIQTHTHTNRSNRLTDTNIHTYTHKQNYLSNTQTYTHTCTHTYMHTHTSTHKHTPTNIHTHLMASLRVSTGVADCAGLMRRVSACSTRCTCSVTADPRASKAPSARPRLL